MPLVSDKPGPYQLEVPRATDFWAPLVARPEDAPAVLAGIKELLDDPFHPPEMRAQTLRGGSVGRDPIGGRHSLVAEVAPGWWFVYEVLPGGRPPMQMNKIVIAGTLYYDPR